MSERNGSNGSGEKKDLEALRAEIRQTRAELGETVQALAARADVKARAKEQVELTKQRVRTQAAEATDRVRAVAQQAGDRVRTAAAQARQSASGESSGDTPAAGGLRPNPILIGAALAAVVGIILIVRGRRR
jgi:uncharacterized protein DUF3618